MRNPDLLQHEIIMLTKAREQIKDALYACNWIMGEKSKNFLVGAFVSIGEDISIKTNEHERTLESPEKT